MYKEKVAYCNIQVEDGSIVYIEPLSISANSLQTPQFRGYHKTWNGEITDITDTGVWLIDKFNIDKGLVTGINSTGSANIKLLYNNVLKEYQNRK